MLILIDNGHGRETRGKCSPDMRLREYAWTREVATMLCDALTARGHRAMRIVPEEYDVPLATRVRRVNDICDKEGAANVVLVSIHVNAGANNDPASDPDRYGRWKNSRGFSVFVSKNASDRSKQLAALLTDEFRKKNLMGNRAVPRCGYWTWSWTTADIYILKNTACPAVLTENLFQDNRDDVEYLLSDTGKSTIVSCHIAALERLADV